MSRITEFKKFNEPHKPDSKSGRFIYKIYRLLFSHSPIKLGTKQSTLESLAVTQYPWKIVCISEKALRHIAVTKNAMGLRRGHPLQRSQRARKLFQRTRPFSYKEFVRYYFSNDTVALIHSDENKRHGPSHWSKLYEVPHERLNRGSFSVTVSKKDREWVRELLQRIHIARRVTSKPSVMRRKASKRVVLGRR